MMTAERTVRSRAVLYPELRLLRALAVLVVLAGVLAMHTLTIGHQALPTVSAVATASASERHAPTHQTVPMSPPWTGLPEAVGLDDCSGCGHELPGPSHAGSHLLDLCVAVLLAGPSRCFCCPRGVPVSESVSVRPQGLSRAHRRPTDGRDHHRWPSSAC